MERKKKENQGKWKFTDFPRLKNDSFVDPTEQLVHYHSSLKTNCVYTGNELRENRHSLNL